jgi:hypothetical protein
MAPAEPRSSLAMTLKWAAFTASARGFFALQQCAAKGAQSARPEAFS